MIFFSYLCMNDLGGSLPDGFATASCYSVKYTNNSNIFIIHYGAQKHSNRLMIA